MARHLKAAVIGHGSIGSDLVTKIIRQGQSSTRAAR